jgi:hypothetical protein
MTHKFELIEVKVLSFIALKHLARFVL